MKAITKQETIDALKNIFDYEAHKESREVMVALKENGDATFMVDKRYMERFEVIDKLQEFFADKYIDGGQCRVDNITFLWTAFYIEERATKKEN